MNRNTVWPALGLALLLGACGESGTSTDAATPPAADAAPAANAPAPAPDAGATQAAPAADAEPAGAAPIAGLPDELNTYGCFACHGMNEVRIGPPYRAIAGMYRNQPDAADKLTRKVIEGGGGVWGPVPMISHRLTDEQVRPLVEAILAIQ